MASQMAVAIYDTVTVDISASGLLLRSSASKLTFPGHLAVYDVVEEEKDKSTPKTSLPVLAEGEKVSVDAVKPEQHFTQPPPFNTCL